HRPHAPVPSLRADPRRRLTTQPINQLRRLGPHPAPPVGYRVGVPFLAGMGISPLLLLLLLVLQRRVHRTLAGVGLLDGVHCREATIYKCLIRHMIIALFQSIEPRWQL